MKGVQIQVKDDIRKKSRSFTVHNIEVEELYNLLYFYAKKLQEYGKDNVDVISYKGEYK